MSEKFKIAKRILIVEGEGYERIIVNFNLNDQ
jgi:hypothetical protein